MSTEERFVEAVAEEEEPAVPLESDWASRRHERLERKNKAAIEDFLGKGERVHAVAILPRYYGELLTWALQRYTEKEGWRVVRTLGYHERKPVYMDVSTDCDTSENLLANGQMLIEKDDSRFIVTVRISLRSGNSIQVEGAAERGKEIEEFVDGVKRLAREQNFYRGKKIQFGGRIHFLRIRDKSWDSIVLDPAVKREIRANTIGFLSKRKCWAQYGIPQKRGILLAGDPGTGKTLICKALMAEPRGITCITTNAYDLDADEYITELYEMAQDLSPCIVFIEDIDLIGLNREEYHYQQSSALLSLLNVLDGVEEKQEIVTVATTNNLEVLDRAITQRPSRFDRVVKLSPPSLKERRELISLLCQKIPIDEHARDYIAGNIEHYTPAQLQEVIYSLVIEHSSESSGGQSPNLEFSQEDIDQVISRINGGNKRSLGFNLSDNHNRDKISCLEVLEKDKC